MHRHTHALHTQLVITRQAITRELGVLGRKLLHDPLAISSTTTPGTWNSSTVGKLLLAGCQGIKIKIYFAGDVYENFLDPELAHPIQKGGQANFEGGESLVGETMMLEFFNKSGWNIMRRIKNQSVSYYQVARCHFSLLLCMCRGCTLFRACGVCVLSILRDVFGCIQSTPTVEIGFIP